MKKLLLISLVILGILPLASCKKTVQPSAFTVESAIFKVTLIGNVTYNYIYDIPANGAYTVVTAQLLDGSLKPVADWTFTSVPDADGKFTLEIPMKKGAEKNQKYKLTATVNQPELNATFKGDLTTEAVSADQTIKVGTIKCSKSKEE